MKCPKCITTELKQTGYNAPSFCPACGGMWLLPGSRTEIPGMTVESTEEAPATDNPDSKTGLCPSGHGIMIRARIDLDEPFFLEKCTACGGIWFDKGEWQRIAETNLADNLSVIWSASWQRKQSKEKNRESFLAMNRSLLGDPVFTALMDLAETLKNHPEKDRALALLQREIIQP